MHSVKIARSTAGQQLADFIVFFGEVVADLGIITL